MTDYAAVLALISKVGEDHPQLPFMLQAMGVEQPEQLLRGLNIKQDIIPPPGLSKNSETLFVDQEMTSEENRAEEKPLWSFPIVVVESYELHTPSDDAKLDAPEEQIQPLANETVSTELLLAQDAKNTLSLWPKQAVKNGLHQFLERVQSHQQLDVRKLSVQMAKMQPLDTLPYLQTQKLPAEIWLYVDKTHGAHCFHDAYLELYQNLQTHVGPLGVAQTVELLDIKTNHFSGSYHHCHWRKSAKFNEYFNYSTETHELPMPEAGGCVIICAPVTALRSADNFWVDFCEKLTAQKITALLVPLDFTKANTDVSVFNRLKTEENRQQKEFLMSALSLMPHRISLALIRALRCQFTQLGPEVELDIINNTGVNWWHSQNIGHWFEGTSPYQATLTAAFTEYANRNQVYSNRVDLFNDVYHCIEKNIPKELTSFIIEFNVLVLLHANDLLDKEFKCSLEDRVTKYYQQAVKSIEQAQTADNNKDIIDETQFWLSQALRLNIADFDSAVIPDALKTVVTSAKHHWQQATQQQVPEIPVLDDDYYRRLNKDNINNNQGGALVLAKQSTILPKTTENSHQTVTLEIISQQALDANPTIKPQVIANLKNTNIHSGPVANINGKQQIQLTLGSTYTLKTLKETITIKAYNSNDFYWAKSIRQTPQGVKTTAEQFEIHWRNPNPSDSLLLRDLFEVIVYDNAPQWLHDFPPQLDNYGIYSEITVENIPFKMRYIPPGSFLMGSPIDESERNEKSEEFRETQHPIKLTHGFWLAETTVTQVLWMAVMGSNLSDFNPKNNDAVKNNTETELPVDSVSWDDCKAFFNKLEQQVPGLKLTFPSEAQWEYACRAGTHTPFNTGTNISTHQANYDGNYPYNGNPRGSFLDKTLPVISFQPNTWGLYQMHGNLWEWCLDGLREYPKQVEDVVENPIGPGSGSRAALRGGSWINDARYCRSASRDAAERDFRNDSFGVRPCSTIDLQSQRSAAGKP